MDKVRVGIIGCGGIAKQKHMPSLKENSELCEMVYFCDIIPERAEMAAKEYGAKGAKFCADYRELLADKYFPLVNNEQDNTNKLAADLIISQKRMGGLQAVRAPFFPANALLITRLDNLSIYWQADTRRRSVIDNPKRDRIENFESVNEAYVVEDYRCAALVENIQIGDFSAAAAEAGA